jgi:DNA-binding MarR family transcriptional regulator
MSTAHTEPAAVDHARLSAKQARILEYLRAHAGDQTYFKSRLIADDLDLSAKEVGANMRAVVEAADEFDVEKWGYSSGTTWMVTT